MSPAWTIVLQRNRAATTAVVVALLFALLHAVMFRPVLSRYRRAAQQAAELGMPLDAVSAPPSASAKVSALLNDNSLNAAVAEEQGTSGALTAGLLDDVTRLAARRGLEVLATEQGLVTQMPGSVQVRAHLKLRGSYAQFVGLLADLARTRTLYGVDRFALEQAGGVTGIQVWISQIILKRAAARR